MRSARVNFQNKQASGTLLIHGSMLDESDSTKKINAIADALKLSLEQHFININKSEHNDATEVILNEIVNTIKTTPAVDGSGLSFAFSMSYLDLMESLKCASVSVGNAGVSLKNSEGEIEHLTDAEVGSDGTYTVVFGPKQDIAPSVSVVLIDADDEVACWANLPEKNRQKITRSSQQSGEVEEKSDHTQYAPMVDESSKFSLQEQFEAIGLEVSKVEVISMPIKDSSWDHMIYDDLTKNPVNTGNVAAAIAIAAGTTSLGLGIWAAASAATLKAVIGVPAVTFIVANWPIFVIAGAAALLVGAIYLLRDKLICGSDDIHTPLIQGGGGGADDGFMQPETPNSSSITVDPLIKEDLLTPDGESQDDFVVSGDQEETTGLLKGSTPPPTTTTTVGSITIVIDPQGGLPDSKAVGDPVQKQENDRDRLLSSTTLGDTKEDLSGGGASQPGSYARPPARTHTRAHEHPHGHGRLQSSLFSKPAVNTGNSPTRQDEKDNIDYQSPVSNTG